MISTATRGVGSSMIIILDLFLRLQPERGVGDVVGEVRGELQVDKTGVNPEVEQFGVRNS